MHVYLVILLPFWPAEGSSYKDQWIKFSPHGCYGVKIHVKITIRQIRESNPCPPYLWASVIPLGYRGCAITGAQYNVMYGFLSQTLKVNSAAQSHHPGTMLLFWRWGLFAYSRIYFYMAFIKGRGEFCVKNKKFKEGKGPNYGPYKG